MNDFKETLKKVEEAYQKLVDGELGETELISEGASSYAIVKPKRTRYGCWKYKKMF